MEAIGRRLTPQHGKNDMPLIATPYDLTDNNRVLNWSCGHLAYNGTHLLYSEDYNHYCGMYYYSALYGYYLILLKGPIVPPQIYFHRTHDITAASDGVIKIGTRSIKNTRFYKNSNLVIDTGDTYNAVSCDGVNAANMYDLNVSEGDVITIFQKVEVDNYVQVVPIYDTAKVNNAAGSSLVYDHHTWVAS